MDENKFSRVAAGIPI